VTFAGSGVILGPNADLNAPRSEYRKLFLHSENRISCRFGNTKFDNDFGWNLDLLLRLGIDSSACLSLLFDELTKTG